MASSETRVFLFLISKVELQLMLHEPFSNVYLLCG
jgi:hypothetical protein